ncbi:META domain-containing protein [Nocardioides oleivorans]|uniref:META domain-containing protein n=1 Tax=Nocardioides oleivorans TaxID=273676 RepID=A0A4Q2RS18_9ACTN|nr:META domain-containing protein [Nocardioides oleivorans]RYB90549.1 META domain-containing protein [Nocardioides oleivorans]
MGVRRVLGAVATASLLVLVGCSPSGGPDVDVEGTWVLVAGRTADDPLAVPPGSRVSLTFAGSDAGGKGPCNDYGSSFDVDGSAFEITGPGGISQTLAGCDGSLGVLESAYLAALGEVDTVARDGDELTLRGKGSELVFTATAPWPRAAVVGHTWRLASWRDDAGVEHRATDEGTSRPTLLLEMRGRRGGPITSTSGCRTMRGHWTEWRGQPTVMRSGWKGDCLHFTDRARAIESMMSELVLEVRERDGHRELVVRNAHGASGAELVYRL